MQKKTGMLLPALYSSICEREFRFEFFQINHLNNCYFFRDKGR